MIPSAERKLTCFVSSIVVRRKVGFSLIPNLVNKVVRMIMALIVRRQADE
jgi:hypothetical protein